jgi:hypothetical protein
VMDSRAVSSRDSPVVRVRGSSGSARMAVR